MGKRLDLHDILKSIPGVREVYFQPPEDISLKYPCIVYSRSDVDTRFADNAPYSMKKRYSVTVIDPDPDSEIPDHIARLPMSIFARHFRVDKLNHDNYSLYF